jgi:hypothetical protein
MHKFTSDAEGVTTTLTYDRLIDVDAEGGEQKGVIIVMNMLVELNRL